MLSRFSALIAVITLLLVLGCSGSSSKNPVVPASETQDEFTTGDLRSLAVDQNEPGMYWNVPLIVEGEIWASHYNDNGTLHRAIGPGVDAPDPLVFIEENPSIFLVNPDDLIVMKDEIHDGIRYLIYNQTYNGILVAESRVDFRYSRSGKLVMIGADVFPFIDIPTTPGISINDAYQMLVNDVNEEYAPVFTDSELVVYTVPETGTLAYRIDAGDWRMYINANDGSILKRINNVWNTYSGSVMSSTRMQSPLDPDISVPGSFVEIGYKNGTGWFDGTIGYAYTGYDATGTFEGTIDPAYASVECRSPWVTCQGGIGGPQEWVNDGDHHDWTWDNSNTVPSERIVFYWVNTMHDYIKNIDPDIDALDFRVRANVNNSPLCNASASANTMNFYQPGDGCLHTGEIPDVICHEYGHVLTFHQYSQNVPTDVHEGCSDYIAASVTGQTDIGNDIRGTDTRFRSVVNNYVWPADIACPDAEPHCMGNILSGCFWDTHEMIGAEYTDYLFIFSRYGEPLTFHDFGPEVLILDDDNDNVLDGTANYDLLVEAWDVNHGIELPSAPDLPTDGVTVDVWPVKPPVVIGQSGGSIPFTVRLKSLEPYSVSYFQIWAAIDVDFLGGFYGPIIPPAINIHAPYNLALNAQAEWEIGLSQWIPGGLPAGTYPYHIRIGTYVDNVNDILIDDAWFDIVIEE